VRIRRVEPDEWEALREVRLAALADSPDAFGATLEDERRFDEARWRGWATGDGWAGEVATFVADGGASFAGMATGFHPEDEPTFVHLFAMWVRPEDRRGGIGRQLVDAVVRWASDQPSVDQVVLRVTIANEDAVWFYTSCGFVGTSERPAALREGSSLMTQTMRLLIGTRSDEELLRSQIAYYEDRAPTYEDWWYRRGTHDRGPWVNDRWFAETAIAEADLRSIDATGDVLEVACGSGIWTRILAPRARRLVALDASEQMIRRNRLTVADPTVDYRLEDVFAWDTDERFDVIVSGFFVSHIPPSRFEGFFTKLARWLRPGGLLWLVDDANPWSTPSADAASLAQTHHAHRRLVGENEYTIVKLFYPPEVLADRLERIGWDADLRSTGEHFLVGTARPR
jgi:2-polyprenyl-3-methyl-5-hydroxy-6-metoxy-1,4-benzoquinol methylase/ribosomal protein S18 acetylase RimI-like enzyme